MGLIPNFLWPPSSSLTARSALASHRQCIGCGDCALPAAGRFGTLAPNLSAYYLSVETHSGNRSKPLKQLGFLSRQGRAYVRSAASAQQLLFSRDTRRGYNPLPMKLCGQTSRDTPRAWSPAHSILKQLGLLSGQADIRRVTGASSVNLRQPSTQTKPLLSGPVRHAIAPWRNLTFCWSLLPTPIWSIGSPQI
jgi:hypothetical protein